MPGGPGEMGDPPGDPGEDCEVLHDSADFLSHEVEDEESVVDERMLVGDDGGAASYSLGSATRGSGNDGTHQGGDLFWEAFQDMLLTLLDQGRAVQA